LTTGSMSAAWLPCTLCYLVWCW